MSVENRLGFPSRERVAIAAVATAIVTVPLARHIAIKELSSLKVKKEQKALLEKSRQEAIKLSKDSVNSGNSGFDF